MKRSVVAIGLFDGVHIGHRSILDRVVAEARRRDATAVVVTFEQHPAEVTQPGQAPLLLTDAATKKELIMSLGIDKVVMISFSLKIAQLSPERFLLEWVKPLNPELILVGEDFRFGRDRKGDVKDLNEFAKAGGFESLAIPLKEAGGEKASSSLAREKIARGDIKGAWEILGRYPVYRGTVVKGEKRGRELGFPTANIKIAVDMCIPADGVYAGRLQFDGLTKPSVINVGRAPTFGSRQKTVIEAYVLDYEGELYEKHVKVEFQRRLREEKRFKSAGDLASQIAQDARRTRDMIR